MHLKNSKIIVIKIGSSLLVNVDKKIRKKWLTSFAKDIKKLKSKNKKIVIVSSGAIALGCKKMNYTKTNLRLDKSQAIASIGQIELMNLFSQTFLKFKLNISQILLTLDDTEERRRSINAKRTFENLFKLDYIPIVNENDTIATSEIKYGDNDRLASRVAQITNADTLILLSDVDGLFTKNPKMFKDAKLIKTVNNLSKDIKNINIRGMTEFGSGGMNTKIEASKICNLAGCNMVIANGLYPNPISQIEKNNNCTWFISKTSKLHARKKWIISSISPKGELTIDEGAKKALINGKSLLAAGIKRVSGKFSKGDHIKILDNKKREFARGLSSFSSEEINKIMGCHSNEIREILGYVSKSEVVHKDDMVEIS
jgi:glutamate 5-kinase